MLQLRGSQKSKRSQRFRGNPLPVPLQTSSKKDWLRILQMMIMWSQLLAQESTRAKEIGAVKSELQKMRSELGSLKKLVTDFLDFVRVQLSASAPPAPTQSMPETPAPSSPPPTSFTAPPAPETFKKALPKHISSPTPFAAASSSSLISSSSIPPTTSEAPLASSSLAGPSSVGPSSQPPPTSSFGSLHPPTPPSFITIIPEAASVIPHSVHDIKDEFKEAILHTVLAVSAHIHRTDSQPSSSPTSKKRKTSSALVFPSNQTLFPPLWYSLSVVNRRRTLYAEYLQKCTFATTFVLPYLNLSEHLNIILPTSGLPKAEQAKILSSTESKTEDQWARANKTLNRKFEIARSNIFPPKDHPLTLLEWFVCQHRDSWGPFIQKEIKFIRQFQMYQDYCFVNRLPEVQLGQFRAAIALLRTENPVNTPLQVDFATLKMQEIAYLHKLHFLLMDSKVGPIIFERFARVMAKIFVQQGAPLAFHRFLFREYQSGFIKSSVLTPLLSEAERYVNTDWCKASPEAALLLEQLNSSLHKSNQQTLTLEKFMDLNSLNLVSDPYSTWIERYKIFIALKKDFLAHKLHCPLSIDKFI
ncbi:hypothetical protein Taro_021143 [Colocasia esculenta]|uniref:Uncharacterized protein n=1 Tax=Colocasia esculenta TaxID=4460 RepID=A0A843UY68_COLES|nr:hypothetical protein [Colocasia esculenta]